MKSNKSFQGTFSYILIFILYTNAEEIKWKIIWIWFFCRYLKKHIWSEFFSTFLNIKDVHSLPDLLTMKSAIDDELYSMESELQSQIRTLSNILHKR